MYYQQYSVAHIEIYDIYITETYNYVSLNNTGSSNSSLNNDESKKHITNSSLNSDEFQTHHLLITI